MQNANEAVRNSQMTRVNESSANTSRAISHGAGCPPGAASTAPRPNTTQPLGNTKYYPGIVYLLQCHKMERLVSWIQFGNSCCQMAEIWFGLHSKWDYVQVLFITVCARNLVSPHLRIRCTVLLSVRINLQRLHIYIRKLITVLVYSIKLMISRSIRGSFEK